MGLPSWITFHLILTTALAKEKHKFSHLSLISRYCTGKTLQIRSFSQDHAGLFCTRNKMKELRESDTQLPLQTMAGFLLLTLEPALPSLVQFWFITLGLLKVHLKSRKFTPFGFLRIWAPKSSGLFPAGEADLEQLVALSPGRSVCTTCFTCSITYIHKILFSLNFTASYARFIIVLHADCRGTTQTAQAAQLTCQHDLLEKFLFLSRGMADFIKQTNSLKSCSIRASTLKPGMY